VLPGGAGPRALELVTRALAGQREPDGAAQLVVAPTLPQQIAQADRVVVPQAGVQRAVAAVRRTRLQSSQKCSVIAEMIPTSRRGREASAQ
jgi:hypothetical protein